ncbi:hypothetical protein DRN87_02665 [Candidatus Geothermarchaeota archaeon]|nr:MAG: hypothetical protein DRN87_02665 [Candidatus Geothermarchaeota archaeon]HEW93617.1 TFIIB-type zinc ribbon-containing protein [Thermoprotei archaeon]
MIPKVCPICGSVEFIRLRGRVICKVCGTILEESSENEYYIDRNFNEIILIKSEALDRKYLDIFYEVSNILDIPANIMKRAKRHMITILSRLRDRRLDPYTAVSTALIVSAYEDKNYLITFKDLDSVFMLRYGVKLNRSRILKLIYKLKNSNTIRQFKPDYLAATNLYLNKVIKELNLSKIDKYYYERIWKIINELGSSLSRYLKGKSIKTVSALLIYLGEMSLAYKEDRRPYFNQTILSRVLKVSRFTLRDRLAEIKRMSEGNIQVTKKRFRSRN